MIWNDEHPYSNVLVLVAPHGSPTPSCSQYIATLREMGALVQFSACYAEVSLTRCTQAAAAYVLLQRYEHIDWVFWLDADMCSSPLALRALISVAEEIEKHSQKPVTVSGAYVNRHDLEHGTRLAAHAVKKAESIEVTIENAMRFSATLALCGMGCLLQPRALFMAHCDESNHFCYPNEDYLVPEVCVSSRLHASELAEYIDVNANQDKFYWMNEDFDYCVRELSRARCVYLVSVPFGHEFMQVLYPTSETVLPGLLRGETPRKRE